MRLLKPQSQCGFALARVYANQCRIHNLSDTTRGRTHYLSKKTQYPYPYKTNTRQNAAYNNKSPQFDYVDLPLISADGKIIEKASSRYKEG